MAVEDIKVPDLGGSEDVEVIEVLVGEGQTVEENESLIVLESDKAAMEIPSPRSGVVKSMTVKVGDKVSEGDEILKMEVSDSAEASADKPADGSEQKADASSEASAPAEAKEEAKGEPRTEPIEVPDIGGETDVEVIEVHVAPGDTIEAEQALITLESDKASMDIPAPKGGEIKSVAVKVGDKVSAGSVIGELLTSEGAAETGDEATPAAAGQAPAAEAEAGAAKQEAAPEPAGGGEARTEKIEVPDIGGETDVEVIEVHVAPGDTIEAEQALITLESDKASMDIPAPKGGEIKSVAVKVGDKVSAGSVIGELLTREGAAGGEAAAAESSASAEASADKPAREPEQKTDASSEASAPAEAKEEPAAPTGDSRIYAGPAVRKLARELGVDLSQVQGSGAKGRIQKEDVHEFVKSRLQGAAPPAAEGAAAAAGAGIPPVPDVDFSQFGEVEEVPLSKMHRVTAANMHRNWLNVPAVAQFNEADITDLEAFRQAQKGAADKRGVKLTLLPFLLKACAKVLEQYPQFNVSLHSSLEKMIQKKYIHIGVAVATEAGLVVPVVRDVDRKSVFELAEEVGTLTDKARNRRLSKEEMQGACFTISSLGPIGGTGFTPIVNSPEVAILGVSKTQIKPVYSDGEFVPRQMLPFSLCYDHRAVNGADAGQFATYLAELLSDTRLLIM